MRILVLMKRFGANKDMPVQDFGRQIRLFENLKEHEIDFLCVDFKKDEPKKISRNGIDYYIEPLSLFNFNKFLKKLNCLIKTENYDLVVASTSPIIGIIAHYYSKKYKIPMMYDLQDSFAAYDEYNVPFISTIDKQIIKNADSVVCVSESLRKKISGFRKKPAYVIQNGIDKNLFKQIDRNSARKKLKLPLKSKIIVYIGHLEKLKGADILLDSFNKVRGFYPDACLLLSGKIEKGIDIRQKNIIFREFPKRKDIVLAINSADAAVIPNTKNEFSKYCFPYKLAEYMACNVSIVATDIGDVSLMLKKYPGSLCRPDAYDMATKIIGKLKEYKRVDYAKELKVLDWKDLSMKLSNIIKASIKK